MTRQGRSAVTHHANWRGRVLAEIWAELKARIIEVGLDGTREGFKFAERMFREFAELRQA
jgi:hypothetical protein